MIPATIKNRKNQSLFGILHTPRPGDDRRICIVLLSPGIKSRVAPHRLYVKMAHTFVSMGFTVLRFDFSGLGDSEGENSEIELTELYNAIQLGKYVDDTIDVLDWLESHYRLSKFILGGLCGGAITGLHAGVRDPRVVGLLSIGMPVTLDGKDIDKRRFLTERELEYNRTRFLQKAMHLNAWKRLLSMKSDFNLIGRSFLAPALGKLRGPAKSARSAGNQEITDNLNPLFHPHLVQFARRSEVLLVFGESDKLLWDFQEKYAVKYKSGWGRLKKKVDFVIIEDANHILSFGAWTREMIDVSRNWLDSKFAFNPDDLAESVHKTSAAF